MHLSSSLSPLRIQDTQLRSSNTFRANECMLIELYCGLFALTAPPPTYPSNPSYMLVSMDSFRFEEILEGHVSAFGTYLCPSFSVFDL